MLSFHSKTPLKIQQSDSVGSYMNQYAWDYFMEEMRDEYGDGPNPTENDDWVLFQVQHDAVYGTSYGLFNDSNYKKIVTIDMTTSEDSYFSPWHGVKQKVVEPFATAYLCSAICDPASDPAYNGYYFDYTVEIEDGSEAEESYYDEEEESEEYSEEYED